MFRWLVMLLVASLLVLGFGPGLGTDCMAFQEDAKKQVEDNTELKKQDSDEEEKAEEEVDPAVKAYQDLQKDMQTAQREFMVEVRKAPREEQMKLFMSGGPKIEFAKKFLDYAKEYADSDNEFDAVNYAALNGDSEVAMTAMEILTDKFSDDDRIVRMLSRFSRSVQFPEMKHEQFLTTLAKKSSRDEVKGAAKYSLYEMMQSIPDMKDALAARPEMADALPAASKEFIMKDRGDHSAMLEKMLSDIAENYADVKFGRSTLGKMAGDELFVFKFLSVGKVAPDIEGIDLDGEEFKLSDYRGKVVLLDFWGDW